MPPSFSNALVLSKSQNANGEVVEVQLDFLINYTKSAVNTLAEADNGVSTVSVRQCDTVSSIILPKEGVYALVAALYRTLGDDFERIVEACEAGEA